MKPINDQYIELMTNVLTDMHRRGRAEYLPVSAGLLPGKKLVWRMASWFMKPWSMTVCKEIQFDLDLRMHGKDRPVNADSMIGKKRMDNLAFCVKDVVANNIPGDLIETGVWRGGASILMRAVLYAMGDQQRTVWVADSFQGLPRPDEAKYEADKGDVHYTFRDMAVPVDVVRANFAKYGLLDQQVQFLKGWFKDTLPNAPIEKLAVLRLDGDMYESTMDGLNNLYHKVSPGGYIIVDDWGAVDACKQAVLDYRTTHGITDEIKDIDGMGVYWQKSPQVIKQR